MTRTSVDYIEYFHLLILPKIAIKTSNYVPFPPLSLPVICKEWWVFYEFMDSVHFWLNHLSRIGHPKHLLTFQGLYCIGRVIHHGLQQPRYVEKQGGTHMFCHSHRIASDILHRLWRKWRIFRPVTAEALRDESCFIHQWWTCSTALDWFDRSWLHDMLLLDAKIWGLFISDPKVPDKSSESGKLTNMRRPYAWLIWRDESQRWRVDSRVC